MRSDGRTPAEPARRMAGPGPRRAATLLLVALVASACGKKDETPATEDRPTMKVGAVVAKAPQATDTAAAPEAAAAPSTAGSDSPTVKPPPPDYPFLSLDEISKDEPLRALVLSMREPDRGKDTLEGFVARDEDGFGALSRALRAGEVNVRFQAALFLAAWKGKEKEAVRLLCLALEKDPEDDVRASAAKGLKMLEQPSSEECLIKALANDPFETARANAAWALGTLASKKALDPLIAALEDETTWVRLRAVSALKRIKSNRAVPALVERLRDENKMVRERTLETLRALTGKKLPGDYDAWAPYARKAR